eukprot:CAMPEP_0117666636 /NCGR_PEP_ID=MMETSP0804-20121206/10492_1 /TAXON_ID=1074897 /ORGANISM="Tetraselmis astigmatica, Strain CCMP880" /LENGTH=204 /DNA_ID=CAMNT_0005474215 /DNA_START=184 /DNA_END=803 /DNA_ORIENTATION=-
MHVETLNPLLQVCTPSGSPSTNPEENMACGAKGRPVCCDLSGHCMLHLLLQAALSLHPTTLALSLLLLQGCTVLLAAATPPEFSSLVFPGAHAQSQIHKRYRGTTDLLPSGLVEGPQNCAALALCCCNVKGMRMGGATAHSVMAKQHMQCDRINAAYAHMCSMAMKFVDKHGKTADVAVTAVTQVLGIMGMWAKEGDGRRSNKP